MNNFLLCFGFLVLGATNQVTGYNKFPQNKLTEDIFAKTADLFSNGIESLAVSKTSEVLDKIDNRLASLEDAQSECALKEKQAIEQLKRDNDVNVCLNVTDVITDIHGLINDSVTVVLETGKGIVSVFVAYGNCTLDVGVKKQLQCIETFIQSLENISVNIIDDISNTTANTVSIILGAIVKILQCLAKPNTLELEFTKIITTTCN